MAVYSLSLRRSARLGHSRDHFPALALGNRPTFADLHDIADLVDIAFVMGRVLLGPAHILAIHRVHHAPLDAHDDGFVHLVADDDAFQNSLGHSRSPTNQREPIHSAWS